ncbi:TolC family protein [Lysobacter sp. TY2-98]|uniref:efflux transporter outer membrane subunit n=1 Tax=Lysobacter sp. TY2-98 TaxID=2290922 RepID=UPI000E205B48|nr:TolC family protein [Lysobacter sp. TY2-98]AXK71791.1 TolC family protein [Lysobacter sp. TY2-98]
MHATTLPGALKRALAAALAVALLAQGCATAPPPPREDIQRDALRDASVPTTWSTGTAAGSGTVADNWVASFGDPQLDQLVAEAIAHNTDLRVAAARMEQAAAQVDIADSRLKPAIGILGRASSKPLSDFIAMAAGAIVRLAWEIDLWGRLRYARNAERAMHDASGADYRYAQQSIAAAVARAWFVAAETNRQKALAKQMADDAQSLVGLADKRRRIGAGSQDEVLVARTSAASYADAARQVDLAHAQALRALEILLGRYPGALIAARDDLPAFPASGTAAGLPVDILSRRPDIIAAEDRVAAAFNRVGEAKASFLPTLSVLLGAGRLESSTNGFEDEARNTRSASAVLNAPIYTGGALTGSLRARNAEQEQAVADYGRLALQAFNEAEDALNGEQILASRESLLAAAATDSRRVVDLQREAYRVGKVDMRTVTQSLLTANATQITLLHVRRERLNQRVDLHLALGGSFDNAPAAAMPAPASQGVGAER